MADAAAAPSVPGPPPPSSSLDSPLSSPLGTSLPLPTGRRPSANLFAPSRPPRFRREPPLSPADSAILSVGLLSLAHSDRLRNDEALRNFLIRQSRRLVDEAGQEWTDFRDGQRYGWAVVGERIAAQAATPAGSDGGSEVAEGREDVDMEGDQSERRDDDESGQDQSGGSVDDGVDDVDMDVDDVNMGDDDVDDGEDDDDTDDPIDSFR